MKTHNYLSLYLISLSTTPFIGGYNLYSNFTNNLYAADHDIIAIPFSAIIGNLLISLLCLLFQHPYRLKKINNSPSNLLTKLASYVSTALTVAILVHHVSYWTSPHHLQIFSIFLITLCLYIYYQLQLYGVIGTYSKKQTNPRH